MADGFRSWLFDAAGGDLAESWSSGPTAPEPFNMHDGRVGAVVDRTARELGIKGDLDANPKLKQAMFHIVSVLNPTVGHGGMLMYSMMDYVTKFLVRKGLDLHSRSGSKKPFDPEEDDHLSIVGSPMRLLRYLWSMWGSVHPQAHLQGTNGFDDDEDASYFNKWKPKKDEPPAAPAPAPTPAGPPTVIQVIEAMPNSVLQGLDQIALQRLADDIGKVVPGAKPSPKELEAMMIRKGLVGTAT